MGSFKAVTLEKAQKLFDPHLNKADKVVNGQPRDRFASHTYAIVIDVYDTDKYKNNCAFISMLKTN